MDSIGNLELAWSQGYDGSRACFINKNTICYKCGNNLKFIEEEGRESIFHCDGEGLGPVAVHNVNKVFATAEIGIDPKINIFQYPSLQHFRELTDGAKLEYVYLKFSHSDYLATVTGVPEYKLIIWNYVTGKQLCEHPLNHEVPTNITFNPGNWRELCITYENELTFWKIEQSDEEYLIQKTKLKLPAEDSTQAYVDNTREQDAPTRASTRLSKVSVNLPVSSVAGITGDEAVRFEEYIDTRSRVRPVSHAWQPSGDVLIGCKGGQLLKVNGEDYKIQVLYNPGPQLSNIASRVASAIPQTIPEESLQEAVSIIRDPFVLENLVKISAEDSATALEYSAQITEGSFDCLALHKKGVYAAGADGVLRRLSIEKDVVKVMEAFTVGAPVTSINFNSICSKLAVGSSKGQLYVSNPIDFHKTEQLFDVSHSDFVAIDTLYPGLDNCVTVRANGQLQIWCISTSKLLCSMSLGVEATCLSCSPVSHCVAVGTVSGDVVFVDATSLDRPKVVERLRLHEGPVKHITFNKNGHFFLTGSNDGHIFVLDGRPTERFQPLGHITLEGEILGISTYLMEKTQLTRVVVTANTTGIKKVAANKIIHFSLPDDLSKDIEIKHSTLKWDLKDSVISKLKYNLANPATGVAMADQNMIFVLAQNTKQILKISLPAEPPKKPSVQNPVLDELVPSLEVVEAPSIVVQPESDIITMEDVKESKKDNVFFYFEAPSQVSAVADSGSAVKDISDLEDGEYTSGDLDVKDSQSITDIWDLMIKSKQAVTLTSYLQSESDEENSKDSYLHAVVDAPGHQLPGGKVIMSPHLKWLGSVGADGKLCVRAVGALDRPIGVNAHDFRTGGAISLVFSSDTHHVLTIGHDGTLLCHKWNFHPSYLSKSEQALEQVKKQQQMMAEEVMREDAALVDMPEWTPPSLPNIVVTPDPEEEDENQSQNAANPPDIEVKPSSATPSEGATWLQRKEVEAHEKEDLQYLEVKTSLRTKINSMRTELQSMMKENEVVPDIEKLTHHEFDLDIEEQERLQAEGDAEVQRIREEKEFENLAKMYLAELIKKECWHSMEVKGRGLKAFNSDMEVQNYPLKPRTSQEIKKLEVVESRRRNEMAELQQRKEIVEIHHKKTIEEEEFGEDDESNEKVSTSGSLVESAGSKYGGDSELFYSQFELHTRQQKMNQIVLLEDAIHRIKLEFNKQFDEVYNKKESEINKVKERNKRITKILHDLDMPLNVSDPDMGPSEKPEMLLEVRDEEVTVEKYLTPEQKKQKEEDERLEAERLARERRDNWRERGLDMMMGGVLEIRKEDELKKDVPKPAFITGKKEEDWTADEKKAFAEYERKVQELNEEREKYKKQLEVELKKLQGLIQDQLDAFDETLKELFMRKIKTEMVIYQEELKIVSLKYSLMTEEELNNREKEVREMIEHKKKSKNLAQEAVTEAKSHVDQFRDLYDNLQAEDKVMDKEFKRRFHDISSHQQDQLHKLFRRRPRGQKLRHIETPTYDQASGNPFAERPSTARQRTQAQKSLEIALTDLDSPKNCPDNMDEDVWMRFCNYRRQKIESENLVKEKALVLAEMQAFLHKRMEEAESLNAESDYLDEQLTKVMCQKVRFSINLMIQLVLKQGQVEVDQGNFIPDYTESLLIHRHVVEDLNAKIRQMGEAKIANMMESKDFRRGIVQLEWEHHRATMEMEDLQNKMRDVQFMKVTREIQAYLGQDDHDAKIQNDIAVLEQTIALLKQHHEANILERKKILKELKKNMRDRENENGALSSNLEELNVSVNERRNIQGGTGDRPTATSNEEKYREIVQRRKLVDLAKAQAQEVAVLRAEVERLRMRTFPALVQVEH